MTRRYEARACGVRAGMSFRDARKLCPALVGVPPDFELLSEAAVAAHGRVFAATPHVHATSIDECYADVTAAVGAAADDDAEGAKIVARRESAPLRERRAPSVPTVGSA